MSPPLSHRVVRRLALIPLWVQFLVVLGLMLGGLLSRGVLSFVLLGCVAALMAVLAAAQWSLLTAGQRVARVVLVAAVLGVALYRLMSG